MVQIITILAILLLVSGCGGGDGPVAPSKDIVACFSVNAPDGFLPGMEIIFDASCSESINSPIQTFTWNWNDGSDPLVTPSPIVTHIFEDLAVYEVKLTVLNEGSQSDIVSKTVAIEVVDSNQPPVAVFTFENPENWQPGVTITFDATDSYDPDGGDIEYIWYWGDGYISQPLTEPVASHTYQNESPWFMGLRVRDNKGRESQMETLELNFGYPKGNSAPAYRELYRTVDQMVRQGDYIYCLSYSDYFGVIDITNPQHPQVLPNNLDFEKYVRHMAVDDDRAAVMSFFTFPDDPVTIDLIDISNPTDISIIDTIEIEADSPIGFAIKGDLVYVADSETLITVNFSQPGNPIANTVNVESNYTDLVIRDGYLVAYNSYSIDLFDISNPTDPVLMGSILEDYANYSAVLFNGNMLYVVGRYNWLYIFDVTGFPEIVPLGKMKLFYAENITIAGNTLVLDFYKSYNHALIDVSDPWAPSFIGSLPLDSEPHALESVGSLVYTSEKTGLSILDVSTVSPYPRLVNTVPIGDENPSDINIHGETLFISGLNYAIEAWDISSRTSPQRLGLAPSPAHVRNAVINDGYAYVACGDSYDNGSIIIEDISDPEMITQAGYYTITTSTTEIFGVLAKDQYMYVSNEDNLLQIVDVSDPSSPVLTSELESEDYIYYLKDLGMTGDYGFLTFSPERTYILDFTDPASPSILSDFTAAGPESDIFTTETYPFCMSFFYGPSGNHVFNVWDVSQSGNYDLLSSLPVPRVAEMEMIGTYAYILNSFYGLEIIDLSDPTSPKKTGSVYIGPYKYIDVTVLGNYAYVIGEDNDSMALRIIELW